jgi:hypothetical protein
MERKYIFITLVALVLVGAGAFYAGTKYQQTKLQNARSRFLEQGSGPGGQFGQRAGATGIRPVSGKIIDRDEESITVELADGSSKIILLTESSVINKTEEASSEDLSEGVEVMVFGQENSDGSITAQNIQINPEFRERLERLPVED